MWNLVNAQWKKVPYKHMYLFKMVSRVARKDEGILEVQNKMGLDMQPNSFASILSPACMGPDFPWIVYRDRLSNCTHKLEGTCMIAINSYMMLFCWHYMHICALYICYLRGQTLTPFASWKTSTICSVRC